MSDLIRLITQRIALLHGVPRVNNRRVGGIIFVIREAWIIVPSTL